MTVYPPAVIVHGLADARMALSQDCPVTLLSAPGAALYGGCLWWRALLAAANTGYPAFLDCGDAPGRAVEALRLGVSGIILECEPELFETVARIAGQNAVVLAAAPLALDLAAPGAARKLRAWLGG